MTDDQKQTTPTVSVPPSTETSVTADDQRLQEIRARHAASTPGEWSVVTKGNSIQSHAIVSDESDKTVSSGISPKTGNAQFIAHAHQDVPFLLDKIERLQSVRRGLLIQLESEASDCDWHKRARTMTDDEIEDILTELSPPLRDVTEPLP